MSLMSIPVMSDAKQDKDSLATYSWSDVKTYSDAVGSFKTITAEELEKMPMGDLRGKLTGLVPGLFVTETSGGNFLSAAVSGMTNFSANSGSFNLSMKDSTPYILVDNVPVPFNQLMLDINQIESITIYDGIVDRVKAGPMAGTGAISIRTKEGKFNTPLSIEVEVESGIKMTDIIPQWVSGADYAYLNNIARENSELTPLYSEEAIENFRKYNAYDTLYPCVDYKSLMMKNMFDMETVGLNINAGSRNIRFNVSVNALHSGDISKTQGSDINRLNGTFNVGTRIGNWIEASAGFNGMITYRNVGNYNWNDFKTVPECAFPLILTPEKELDITDEEGNNLAGKTIYGVSNTFGNNYYAQMMEGGFYQHRSRSAFFYASALVDFGFFLPGLKSRTTVQTSNFLYSMIGKSNDYLAYYWSPETGIGQRSTSHIGTTQTARSVASRSSSQSLVLSENLWYDWAENGHKVHAEGVFSMNDYAQSGDEHRQRLIFSTFGARYNYRDRYILEVEAEAAGSARYKKGKRWGLFPSVGLAWNIANEEFLKNTNAVQALKIHAQAGEAPYTPNVFGTQYLYQASYATSSAYPYGPVQFGGDKWFGVNTYNPAQTAIERLSSDNLTWERVQEVEVGLDADLFDWISLRAGWYLINRKGLIANVNTVLPDYYGLNGVAIYQNYESNRTTGYQASAQIHHSFSDFSFSIGASIDSWSRIYTNLVSDEYLYDYQKKTGASTTAIRGFRCIGKYETQEQIESLPSYIEKSSLKIGDLIYEDINGDDVIDVNDRVIIGDQAPKLIYTVNLGLSWRDLEFQVIGSGIHGYDYDRTYNSYFTVGSGDQNLSQFVYDQLGKDYPSLSYYKSQNNFVDSDFWIRDRSWFKIQSMELAYTFNFKKAKNVRSLRLALKGENLATFSDFEYCDPEAPTSGISVYPLMRTVTFGAKIKF